MKHLTIKDKAASNFPEPGSAVGRASARQPESGSAVGRASARQAVRLKPDLRISGSYFSSNLKATKGSASSASRRQAGFALLETLIALVILAFGLLGLMGLQTKTQLAEAESYQRAQAVLLLQDMADRLRANVAGAAGYLTNGSYIGTGYTDADDCSGLGGAAEIDRCEWSKAIKGAAESRAGVSAGAMTDGRGCVEQISANPAVYRVSVAWQGMVQLAEPALPCGQGFYGDDGYRRVIASVVTVPDLTAP
jgi:type IV pilus assembly protein PilV